MVSRPGILAGGRAWREGGNGGRRLGVARGKERRCLNRALDRDVAVTAKMPPYHDVPRPARVRGTYGATAGRRVARGKAEVSRARRRPWEDAWPRAACDLGRRGVGRRAGADAEGAGAASRCDVAAQSAIGPFSIC
jgi:hypothetical protein